MLGILAMSLCVFADGTSCSIRGLSGESVSLLQENAQSGKNSQVCVKLTNSSDRQVQVIVKCYDAYTDRCVGVVSTTVQPYGGTACFDVEKEHPYYFRVSDAHCG